MTVKIKYLDFTQATRSRTTGGAVAGTDEVVEIAELLLASDHRAFRTHQGVDADQVPAAEECALDEDAGVRIDHGHRAVVFIAGEVKPDLRRGIGLALHHEGHEVDLRMRFSRCAMRGDGRTVGSHGVLWLVGIELIDAEDGGRNSATGRCRTSRNESAYMVGGRTVVHVPLGHFHGGFGDFGAAQALRHERIYYLAFKASIIFGGQLFRHYLDVVWGVSHSGCSTSLTKKSRKAITSERSSTIKMDSR